MVAAPQSLRQAALAAYQAEESRKAAAFADTVDRDKAHLTAAIEKCLGAAWTIGIQWDHEDGMVIAVADHLRFRLLWTDLEVERTSPDVYGITFRRWDRIKSLRDLGFYMAMDAKFEAEAGA